MGLFYHSRVRRRRRLRQFGAVFAALWFVTCVYQTRKPLPQGVSVAGPLRTDSEIEFLADLTYLRDGEQVTEHVIFDRVLALIDSADVFLVADMFLFNDEHAGDRPYRPLTTQLTQRMIARRLAHPQMPIVFITDPINSFYGAYATEQMSGAVARLQRALFRGLAHHSRLARNARARVLPTPAEQPRPESDCALVPEAAELQG